MKTINNIKYDDRVDSNATLIQIPIEGQTPLPESQEMINQRSYQLSTRNGANAYIISTDKEKVHLNFIPQKVFVDDTDLIEMIGNDFEYYIDEEIETIPLFVLADGIIFRCVSADSKPKSKENYTYYIMMNGRAKQIPNYKTLEVMLAERNQNLLSVRVLEMAQCQQLIYDPIPVPDKSGSWKEEFEDITNLEALAELENNAKAASAIAEDAKKSAGEQIAAVKAEAEAAKAEAEAAKAEAEATSGEG